MKVVIGAGVVFLIIAVLFVGMILPDTFEAFALSKVATYAEDVKRARIIDSPEYGVLEIENERLHDQLRSCQAGEEWVPEGEKGVLSSILGVFW